MQTRADLMKKGKEGRRKIRKEEGEIREGKARGVVLKCLRWSANRSSQRLCKT